MKILRVLIYSNLLVSIAAGAITFSCAYFLNSEEPIIMGLILFSATLFTYNIQRIIRIEEIQEQLTIRHKWLIQHIILNKSLALFGLIGSVFLYFFVLGWAIDFWLLAGSAILGLLYAFKIRPHEKGSLRDIPHLKIYLIAFQWVVSAVLWPVLREENYTHFPWLLSISVFCYIMASTIPFDIRDLKYDDDKKMTIPQLIGKNNAKLLSLLLLIASALCFYYISHSTLNWLWFILAFGGMGILISFSSSQRDEMYFSGLIDGWIITFAVLLYFL